jgi:hypothetical protein
VKPGTYVKYNMLNYTCYSPGRLVGTGFVGQVFGDGTFRLKNTEHSDEHRDPGLWAFEHELTEIIHGKVQDPPKSGALR